MIGSCPGIVVGKQRLLRAVPVDHLAEIALLVEQSDADDRHAQIAGRLELIAGHVAQAARVDRQRLAQHELHAEIGHAASAATADELCWNHAGRLRRLPPAPHQVVDLLAERRDRPARSQSARATPSAARPTGLCVSSQSSGSSCRQTSSVAWFHDQRRSSASSARESNPSTSVGEAAAGWLIGFGLLMASDLALLGGASSLRAARPARR